MGQQTHFFVLVASCSFASSFATPYNDGVTSYKCPSSPQSHTAMYTTFGLSPKKCDINVVLGQVVVENSTMMYCIHNVCECPCQLHISPPKGNKSCSPFHIRPPLLIRNREVSCCNPTLLKEFPHSTTMCMPPQSLYGWQKIG
jgi:hypothetical protein